jgi:hypothetical protein
VYDNIHDAPVHTFPDDAAAAMDDVVDDDVVDAEARYASSDVNTGVAHGDATSADVPPRRNIRNSTPV